MHLPQQVCVSLTGFDGKTSQSDLDDRGAIPMQRSKKADGLYQQCLPCSDEAAARRGALKVTTTTSACLQRPHNPNTSRGVLLLLGEGRTDSSLLQNHNKRLETDQSWRRFGSFSPGFLIFQSSDRV